MTTLPPIIKIILLDDSIAEVDASKVVSIWKIEFVFWLHQPQSWMQL